MTPAPIEMLPSDVTALLTSLGVFSLAIAAVVGGIYKGIKEVKKGTIESDEVRAGVILEVATAKALAESNLRLVDTNKELLEILRQSDRRMTLLIESLQDQREMTRSQVEEQHRLRAATIDLIDYLRRQ